jgi:hypothetical protein
MLNENLGKGLLQKRIAGTGGWAGGKENELGIFSVDIPDPDGITV